MHHSVRAAAASQPSAHFWWAPTPPPPARPPTSPNFMTWRQLLYPTYEVLPRVKEVTYQAFGHNEILRKLVRRTLASVCVCGSKVARSWGGGPSPQTRSKNGLVVLLVLEALVCKCYETAGQRTRTPHTSECMMLWLAGAESGGQTCVVICCCRRLTLKSRRHRISPRICPWGENGIVFLLVSEAAWGRYL